MEAIERDAITLTYEESGTGDPPLVFVHGWTCDITSVALDDQVRDQQIIAGTPKTVIPKFRRLLEETRPSILGIWGSDGFVSNADTKTCIRLLGEEVLPAVREIGKDLGLWSPFEANAPVSLAFPEPARPAGENGAGGRS